MTNDKPLHHLILRKLSAFLLFLAVGITLSFSQKSIPSEQSKVMNMQEPLIERANSATIKKDNIIILSGNVIIRIHRPDNRYTLIKTENATFDKEKKIIKASKGKMEEYKSENTNPIKFISYDTLMYDLKSNDITVLVNFNVEFP